MIKKIARFILAVSLYYSGVMWLWMVLAKRRSARPLILMYHRVLEKNDEQAAYTQRSLIINARVFKAQMAFLKRKYKIISLSDLANLLTARRPLPKRALVITFDDGWRDNYTNAFPVLNVHKIPATIFLTVDYIESGRTMWFSRLGRILASKRIPPERIIGIFNQITGEEIDSYPGDSGLPELLKKYKMDMIEQFIGKLSAESNIIEDKALDAKEMLTWNEIAWMRECGIEFGSHGLSHSILTLLGEPGVREELCRSKSIMESIFGEKVTSFAYPNGNHNAMIREIAQEAGYQCALATGAGSSDTNGMDLYALRRIGIHDDISTGPLGHFSKSLLMFHISGIYDKLKKFIV